MFRYFVKRLFLVIPTLFGITLVCFLIINLAPGGPIERKIAQLRFGGALSSLNMDSPSKRHNVTNEVISALKKQYGFDRPLMSRYFLWLKKAVVFDFGDSFVHEEPALDVILSRLPISLQFGFVSFFLIYLISIPLGVYKAVKDGSKWDGASSFILIVLFALPPLILGILMKTYFTGGGFLDWFPTGDLYSDEYLHRSFLDKVKDRAHHFVLPALCYTLSGFTILTFLMKNSLLECIRAEYIRTAYAKGLSQKIVIAKHAFKNALIPIVTGLGNFLQIFFAGSLIVEKIFNLDGIGLLGYQAAVERDFHVLLALLFFQAMLNLAGRMVSDFSLAVVDPRITFSK